MMTGPPSGSQSHLVEKKVKEGVRWAGHITRSGGEHTEVCSYLIIFFIKHFILAIAMIKKRHILSLLMEWLHSV